MKDFFKRIGRGIKKVGRKIGDFFESKVGKILGGIMLAVALPQIFSSFFSGTVTTGAGATKTTMLGDKIVGTAQEGIKAVSIDSTEAAVKLGQRFKSAAKQMGEIFTSPIDATKRTLDFMTGGRLGAQTKLPTGDYITGEFAIPEGSAFRGTAFAKPELGTVVADVKTAIKVDGVTVPDALESVFTPEQIDNANQLLSSNNSFRFEGPTGNWVDKATGKPLTKDQLNAFRFENTLSTRAKEKLLQNKDIREWYDNTTNLLADSETYDPLSAKLGLRPSGSFRGVSEYPTLGQAGNPINQMSHIYNKSWGELTGYGGPLSETSVARSSYLGYTTVDRMFGTEEQPSFQSYNPSAIEQVSRNLALGSQFITSDQVNKMYEPLQYSTPKSATSIIKDIHNKVGLSYAYGSYAPFNNYAEVGN